MCGYAGCYSRVGGIDGDGVGGAVGVGVFRYHLGEVEAFCEVVGYGSADEATVGVGISRRCGGEGGGWHVPCVSDHEGHFLCRDIFGGNDEVSFIFAIGRVEHNNEFPVAEGADCGVNAVEVELRFSIG